MEGLRGYDRWKTTEPPTDLTFEEWDPVTAADDRALAESEPGEEDAAMRGPKDILEDVERQDRQFFFTTPGAIEAGRYLFGVRWDPDSATDADITEIREYLRECGLW